MLFVYVVRSGSAIADHYSYIGEMQENERKEKADELARRVIIGEPSQFELEYVRSWIAIGRIGMLHDLSPLISDNDIGGLWGDDIYLLVARKDHRRNTL